ncbi:hypothetical protein Tco_0940090 [Tanacetum coccineum]|uniref:Reverse transcriptase Ty1/copia-type domain-containing protein n=1 Tax=Tanacetum coccineum TaxID=301880 RepID=A0ABQ5DMG7_9ASTR
MVPPNNLGPDLGGKAVNETQYRGMIGSLMYLNASRPDIQFSTCLCARYHAITKIPSFYVKRIFMYLKGTPSLGLWYPKCLGFDLKGYLDSDYAYCNMDRKSTSSACQLLGGKLIYHFIRDHILKGDIELHFIPTQYQLADIFTTPLDELTFKRLIVELYSREIREKGTLKKNCLPPRWRLLMGQIIQCLGGKTSGLDQISNKDATILFISLLLENMMPEYDNEDLIINPTQVFSVYNWTLKPNQPKEPPFTAHMKAICKLDVLVVSKAPKPSSQTEEVPKAKSLELKVDSEENNLQNTHLSPRLRHTNPKLANQKQKLSPVRPRIKAQAILHLPLYFFYFHSESTSGHDALADSTAKADLGSSDPNDSISS